MRLKELCEEVAMFLEGKCDFAKYLRNEEFILKRSIWQIYFEIK